MFSKREKGGGGGGSTVGKIWKDISNFLSYLRMSYILFGGTNDLTQNVFPVCISFFLTYTKHDDQKYSPRHQSSGYSPKAFFCVQIFGVRSAC